MSGGRRAATPLIRRYYQDKALCLSIMIICGLLISIRRCVNALMDDGNVTRLTILLTNCCTKLYYNLMTAAV